MSHKMFATQILDDNMPSYKPIYVHVFLRAISDAAGG